MASPIGRLFLTVLIAFPFILLAAIFARLEWPGTEPKRPDWMPVSSIWVSGPHTPLEFHRVGEWIGCKSNSEPSIECWFTDDKGKVTFSDRFASVDGGQVDRLQIAPGSMADFRFYSQGRDTVIHIVRLDNGTVLAPVRYKSEFGAIQRNR
jgi:hypothetical protein